MKPPNHVYIALGSNKGDRLKHLQDAVELIFKEIGKVNIIAKVYNTPAFGFDGADFLNTCLYAETDFSAEDLLGKLLQIETKLGRSRTPSETYEARTIDLDVLFCR